MAGSRSLLDEALPTLGKALLIEDCVETSGGFLLHHLVKRFLLCDRPVILVAFANTFSHYDRILRKLGCNLAAPRDKNRFVFVDMLDPQLQVGNSGGTDGSADGDVGFSLYERICKAVRSISTEKNSVAILVDDLSLMEVACKGSVDDVIDFLHHCHTLIAESDCSFVFLNHHDIYSSMERPSLMLYLEYMADVLLRVEPLATGSAVDVHGQLTVLNRGVHDVAGTSRSKFQNFHYRVKENGIECFYPGSRG
ncbi:hypothetical protein MLD38_008771 [Melastoma candidum]|uniref:Uncharacterized protein n=1 Tax=Melastoma candidum TaxID=119954 RepID=A0ACB9RYH6_9MYRT|nr:hypothetical protein MLD38_008771 [Melastoma candidum]